MMALAKLFPAKEGETESKKSWGNLIMIGQELLGFLNISWQTVVMLTMGSILIYLAVARNIEPALLLPIGIGIILTNIPP